MNMKKDLEYENTELKTINPRDEYGRFLKGNLVPEKRFKDPADILAIGERYLEQVEQSKKAATMAGLALALGFRSRQALLNYKSAEGYEQFHDVVNYLKLKMEEQLEDRLLDPNNKNVAGTIFNMKNNYGYADKQEIKMDSRNITLEGFAFAPPIENKEQ